VSAALVAADAFAVFKCFLVPFSFCHLVLLPSSPSAYNSRTDQIGFCHTGTVLEGGDVVLDDEVLVLRRLDDKNQSLDLEMRDLAIFSVLGRKVSELSRLLCQ